MNQANGGAETKIYGVTANGQISCSHSQVWGLGGGARWLGGVGGGGVEVGGGVGWGMGMGLRWGGAWSFDLSVFIQHLLQDKASALCPV